MVAHVVTFIYTVELDLIATDMENINLKYCVTPKAN